MSHAGVVLLEIVLVGRSRTARGMRASAAMTRERALQAMLDPVLELGHDDQEPRDLRGREDLSQLGESLVLEISEPALVRDGVVAPLVECLGILDRVGSGAAMENTCTTSTTRGLPAW